MKKKKKPERSDNFGWESALVLIGGVLVSLAYAIYQYNTQ